MIKFLLRGIGIVKEKGHKFALIRALERHFCVRKTFVLIASTERKK